MRTLLDTLQKRSTSVARQLGLPEDVVGLRMTSRTWRRVRECARATTEGADLLVVILWPGVLDLVRLARRAHEESEAVCEVYLEVREAILDLTPDATTPASVLLTARRRLVSRLWPRDDIDDTDPDTLPAEHLDEELLLAEYGIHEHAKRRVVLMRMMGATWRQISGWMGRTVSALRSWWWRLTGRISRRYENGRSTACEPSVGVAPRDGPRVHRPVPDRPRAMGPKLPQDPQRVRQGAGCMEGSGTRHPASESSAPASHAGRRGPPAGGLVPHRERRHGRPRSIAGPARGAALLVRVWSALSSHRVDHRQDRPGDTTAGDERSPTATRDYDPPPAAGIPEPA